MRTGPLPPRSTRIRVPRTSSIVSEWDISVRDRSPLAIREFHEAYWEQHHVPLVEGHLSDHPLKVFDLLQALVNPFFAVAAALDRLGVKLHGVIEVRSIEIGILAVLLLVAIEIGPHLRSVLIPAR